MSNKLKNGRKDGSLMVRIKITTKCFARKMALHLTHKNSQKISELLKKAGLPKIRLHDLRHTHASLLLYKGVHPKVVQESLGHPSISMTLDLYSHLAPGAGGGICKVKRVI